MSNQSKYMTIYENLHKSIENGIYKNGDKIPSENELAKEYNVSRITSKKALEMLESNGKIVRIPGRGSFVSLSNTTNQFGLPQKVKKPIFGDEDILVGLVMEDFSESFGTRIVSGIERECSELGLNLVIRRSGGSQSKEQESIENLLALGIKGLIVMPVHGQRYNQLLLKLTLDKFPLVLIDRYLYGVSISYVGSDNLNAAKKLTEYLFSLNHKTICLVSGEDVNTTSIKERIRGFQSVHYEHGIISNKADWLTNISVMLPHIYKDNNTRKDVDVIKKYILSHPDVTAFFVIEYYLAVLTYKAVTELGRRVPEDYSIVCFDSTTEDDITDIGFFTHIRQEEDKIGRKAVEILRRHINGEKTIEDIEMEGILIKARSAKSL